MAVETKAVVEDADDPEDSEERGRFESGDGAAENGAREGGGETDGTSGTGDGARSAGLSEERNERLKTGDDAERQVAVASQPNAKDSNTGASTKKRVQFADNAEGVDEKPSAKDAKSTTEATDSCAAVADHGGGAVNAMVVQRAEGKRVVIDYGKLRTTDGGWIDGRPDEEELRKKVDAQLAAALAAFEQSVDRSTRVAMSTKGLKDPADEMSAGGTSRGGTNSATDDTLKAELRVRDKEQGLVLLVKARQQAHDEATKQEMERQLHKRRKRLDHT